MESDGLGDGQQEKDLALDPGNGCPIINSTLSSNADAFQPVLNLSGNLRLDSSLVTGGAVGAVYQGFQGTSWVVNNSTIDAGDAGVDNSADDIDSLALGSPDGSPQLDVTVDSSLLVDDIFIFTGSGYDGPGHRHLRLQQPA